MSNTATNTAGVHVSAMAGVERAKNGKDQLQLMAATIIAEARAGNAPWLRNWSRADIGTFTPRNAVTGRPYTGKNALYLAMVMLSLGLTDGRFCTFKQAKDNGWKIRKGAKSVGVAYYGTHKPKPKAGAEVATGAGKDDAAGEVATSPAYRFVSVANVFHASDVDGMPPVEEPPAHETVDAIELPVKRLIDGFGTRVEFAHFDRDTAPHFVPSQDRILVPYPKDFATAAGFNEVILHELSHATQLVTGRKPNRETSAGRGAEELTAHVSAWLTALQLGVAFDGSNAGAYVRSWEQVADAESVIDDAVKSARALIAAME